MSEEVGRSRIREIGEKATEILKKMVEGTEYVAERLEEEDVPKLVRNVAVIGTMAMSLYTMGYAVSVMLPAASQLFQQLAITLGYLVPILVNLTIFSVTIALVKRVI